ncbi:ATP-binding cassette domain-containing protein, partial [Candidatus Pelagibacter sp. HIMB1521]|uniref:ATP-binding cassette domain-containing protein n=1 Tax=Candidatus Pelagibacter sp. HIMB1521 TaxID=3413344 RepID=UPI003F87FFE5
RSKIILILFLVIMSIVFELFSLALIIPLMSSIFGIETSLTNSQYPLLNDLNNLFGLNNINILLVILFLSGIILKNIVLMASYKNLYSMKFLIEKELSSKLLSNYISSPYSFFMKRNTSNLLHNVTQEIWKFCDVVAGCFYLIAEIIILLGIVSILLIVNTKVTLLIVIILGIFGYFFLKFYKKKLETLGDEKVLYESLRIKQLGDIFGGVKDILMKNNQNYMLEIFKKNYDRIIKPTVYLNVLRAIPRVWIEVSFISLISIFLIYILTIGLDITLLIPQIIFFTVCLIRLFPSITKILFNFQLISFSSSTINLVNKETQIKIDKQYIMPEKEDNKILRFNDSIEVRDLSFEYIKNKKILDNINIQIKKNQMIAITGKSGSGKSTLLNILLGLIIDYNGEIYIDKNLLSEKSEYLFNWKKKIGYIPQSIFIYDDTLRRNIAFGIHDEDINENLIDKSISMSKVDEFLHNMQHSKETNLGEGGIKLSGGQIQRVGIARALYSDPDVLILDEPTSALNSKIEKEIFTILKDLKKTVIIVTHNKENMDICDEVYEIIDGKIHKK